MAFEQGPGAGGSSFVRRDLTQSHRMRKMFNPARTAGLVRRDHVNPAVGIVRFPTRKRRRFITAVEMPRFVEALEQEDGKYAEQSPAASTPIDVDWSGLWV